MCPRNSSVDHCHRPVECKNRHFRSCRVARFSLLNPGRGQGAFFTIRPRLRLAEPAPGHGRYPHQLRAIGHLLEAEDESQEWPQLHADMAQGTGRADESKSGKHKRDERAGRSLSRTCSPRRTVALLLSLGGLAFLGLLDVLALSVVAFRHRSLLLVSRGACDFHNIQLCSSRPCVCGTAGHYAFRVNSPRATLLNRLSLSSVLLTTLRKSFDVVL